MDFSTKLCRKVQEILFQHSNRASLNAFMDKKSSGLKNKVAIVTGGGRGIGRAVAIAFAQHGALVVVSARTKDEIEGVREEILRTGGEAISIAADVTKEEDVENLVKGTVDTFGRIDILVNNAGYRGPVTPLSELSVSDWDRITSVNLRGPFLCTRAVLKQMQLARTGLIINISSLAGKTGYPMIAAYCASKFGLIGLSEALRNEVRDYGVKVTVICPGPVNTQMRASRFPGEDQHSLIRPEDIADSALFIAAQSGNYQIPELIIVNSGKQEYIPVI